MKKTKTSIIYSFVLSLTKIVFKLFYHFRVFGKEHWIPGGALLVPNHVSFLDPPAVAISCPDSIHFLARHSLFKGFLGALIKRLNTHPIYQGGANLKLMRGICQLLKEGKKVLLFPEGTRSADNTLTSIQPGVGLLLSMSRTAIIPMYIDGTFKIWGRGRSFPKLWGRVSVVFGSPILWADYTAIDKKKAQSLITHKIEESLALLKKWYAEGAKGTPP